MRRILKWVALGAATLLVVLMALLLSLPLLLDSESVKTAALQHLSRATGGQWRVAHLELDWFPAPKISVEGASVSIPGTARGQGRSIDPHHRASAAAVGRRAPQPRRAGCAGHHPHRGAQHLHPRPLRHLHGLGSARSPRRHFPAEGGRPAFPRVRHRARALRPLGARSAEPDPERDQRPRRQPVGALRDRGHDCVRRLRTGSMPRSASTRNASRAASSSMQRASISLRCWRWPVRKGVQLQGLVSLRAQITADSSPALRGTFEASSDTLSVASGDSKLDIQTLAAAGEAQWTDGGLRIAARDIHAAVPVVQADALLTLQPGLEPAASGSEDAACRASRP